MARDSRRIQVTLPDNIHSVIDVMCQASGETVTEYCLRSIMNKAEHDLMVKLPDKWRAFTEAKP